MRTMSIVFPRGLGQYSGTQPAPVEVETGRYGALHRGLDAPEQPGLSHETYSGISSI